MMVMFYAAGTDTDHDKHDLNCFHDLKVYFAFFESEDNEKKMTQEKTP